jgi:hypothetical protein
MNPGPRNASRGVRDCSWSLWRPQGRAPRASRTEMSRGLRQRLSREALVKVARVGLVASLPARTITQAGHRPSI